jgi:soluble lytic murein transglycosylase-like protein
LHRSIYLIAVLSLTICTGCTSSDIWGIPQDTFLSRIKNNNTEFLRHLDYQELDLEHVLRLGEGAGYYMSFVFRDLDMAHMARRMLEIEWNNGKGRLQREAVTLLLSHYIEEEQYEKAESIATQAVKTFPDDATLQKMYVESIYWQEKNELVLTQIEKLAAMGGESADSDGSGSEGRTASSGAEKREALFSRDPEMRLFYAATRCELDVSGWKHDFLMLFSRHPASELHRRAFHFLQIKDVLEHGFTDDEKALLRGKHALVQGNYSKALTEWEPLLRNDPALFLTPTLLDEITRLYIDMAAPREGVETLGYVQKQVEARHGGKQHLLYLLELGRGKLSARDGFFRDAAEHYESALSYSNTTRERDAALWLHMRAVYHDSPEELATRMEWYVSNWGDPAYYQDMLEELCSYFVRTQDWTFLLTVFKAIKNQVDVTTELRYRYVILLAARKGLLRLPEGLIEEPETIRNRFCFANESSMYYSFLFSCPLEDLFRDIGAADDATEATAGEADQGDPGGNATERGTTDENGAEDGQGQRPTEKIVDGFLRYGLYREAYSIAYDYISELSVEAIKRLSRQLADQGLYYESITTMRKLLLRDDYRGSREEYRMLYPRAFLPDVRRLSREQELPLPVFYGLVREESYFDPRITSRAGAVGLAQLMPSTAEHVASLMKKEMYTLTDPSDNLAMGAFYLGRLFRRFKQLPNSLYAYNAGPTRVRQWERMFGDLPGELFLEAIPFRETRNYGRKVLVSAVFYGYFYENASPQETIQLFFPENAGLGR